MKQQRFIWGIVCLAGILAGSGCGGGSGSVSTSSNGNTTSTPSSPPQGSVNLVISDDSTQDWATIGVKILSVAFVPQGGGTNVTVYTAPSPTPLTNLVQLDQVSDVFGNVPVAPGTYTSAVMTLSANPGDVALVAAAEPETGFAGTPGQAVPASQIQIQGAQGNSGSMTVPVKINFVAPITIAANQSTPVDIEFNLAHPAFIVDHVPAGGGAPFWAVNFSGPLRHRPVPDITKLILRDLYGTVTTVSSSSLTITKDYPVEPAKTPETAMQSSQ